MDLGTGSRQPFPGVQLGLAGGEHTHRFGSSLRTKLTMDDVPDNPRQSMEKYLQFMQSMSFMESMSRLRMCLVQCNPHQFNPYPDFPYPDFPESTHFYPDIPLNNFHVCRATMTLPRNHDLPKLYWGFDMAEGQEKDLSKHVQKIWRQKNKDLRDVWLVLPHWLRLAGLHMMDYQRQLPDSNSLKAELQLGGSVRLLCGQLEAEFGVLKVDIEGDRVPMLVYDLFFRPIASPADQMRLFFAACGRSSP